MEDSATIFLFHQPPAKLDANLADTRDHSNHKPALGSRSVIRLVWHLGEHPSAHRTVPFHKHLRHRWKTHRQVFPVQDCSRAAKVAVPSPAVVAETTATKSPEISSLAPNYPPQYVDYLKIFVQLHV